MAYYRASLFNPDIVKFPNEDILENEISLGRWLVDSISLLSSKNESYSLNKVINIKELGITYIPTIYFKNGCKALSLEGSTIIDIRSNLLYDTEINKSEIFKYLIDNRLIENLLIVYINGQIINTISPKVSRIQFKKADNLINIIKSAIKENKGDILPILNSKPDDWLAIRQTRILNASNDFKRFNSVFFLGAGVSVSANIPNWKALLEELMLSKDCYCKEDYDEVSKEMDYSYLLTARYIEKATNLDKKSVVNSIRNIIYSKSKKSSKLINTICSMISEQQKVQSVITYNYDTLIEDNLNNVNKKAYSVYKYIRSDSSSFPVYHVHGVIFPDSYSNISEDIVLSEEDYHDVYSKVFDWSNVEQLHALTRNTCFFIGLSMKDPNLRRLMEIAQKGCGKSIRHYVFLERRSFYKDKKRSELDFQTRESILADLGLNVIWYNGGNNHQELHIILDEIHKGKTNEDKDNDTVKQ